MSANGAVITSLPLEPVRFMLCVLPDDGTDRVLIRALRKEWGINVADSVACRGVSVPHEAKPQQANRLPESTFTKLLQIIVPEATATAVFDFVAVTARIGRLNGGVLVLSQPIQATPFCLPEGLPDETE